MTEPAHVLPEESQVPDRPRRRWPVAVVILALLFGVGFVVTFVDRSGLQDDADRRRDIETVAGEFAATLLSYDYTDIAVVETEVRSETSQARVTTYLDLSLLRVDGTWLVNELGRSRRSIDGRPDRR